MSDHNTTAAERVRRTKDHREPLEIIYGTDDFESAEWGYSNDIDTLAAAYLAQQPAYEQQAAEIAELRAKLEAAEKERDDLLNTAATLGQQVCRDKPRRDRLAAFEDERPVDCKERRGE